MVAATWQRADQFGVMVEPGVELASDRKRLVQPGRVAERPSHLGEVRRGTDRETVADAHMDVPLRLGGARQAFAHRLNRLGRLSARDRQQGDARIQVGPSVGGRGEVLAHEQDRLEMVGRGVQVASAEI